MDGVPHRALFMNAFEIDITGYLSLKKLVRIVTDEVITRKIFFLTLAELCGHIPVADLHTNYRILTLGF